MTPVIKNKSPSYAFIDLCKVVCIFLIVMNHLSTSYHHISYMKSFRIPLFFFAAGFLFSLPKYENLKAFLKDRHQRLIIPYFAYYGLALVVDYGFMMLRYPDQFVPSQFIKHILGAAYSVGTSEWMIAIPLWFLTCLFCVELLYFIMAKYSNNRIYLAGIIVLLSWIGFSFYKADLPRLPWNLDIALMALPFFGAGHMSRSYISSWLNIPIYFRVIWGLLFFILNFAGSRANDLAIMSWRQYGDFGLFFINGFTGIASMIFLTSLVPESKLVKFIGRNTLTILGMHGFVMIFLLKLTTKFSGINVWNLIPDEGIGLLLTIGIFFLLMPIILFVNQFMPWLAGKR